VQRRHLDFQDFDAVRGDIEHLRAHGYQKTGNWDLVQICDHLSATMYGSLHGFSFQAPWLVRKLLAPLVLRRILKTRQLRAGVRVPQMDPPANTEPEKAIARCLDLLREVQQHRGDFQVHPFFGKLASEHWRQLHLIHSAHHLSFLVPA
jgi:hypothetical protein